MLYQRLLNDDFDKLAPVLRAFHCAPGGARARGLVEVRRSNRLIAALLRFPSEAAQVPAELEVVAGECEEVWIRKFGDVVRRSIQWQEGPWLVEKAGPLRLYFQVHVENGAMIYSCTRARVWAVPLPIRVYAMVRGADSSWEVEVSVAGVGCYRGTMVPVP